MITIPKSVKTLEEFGRVQLSKSFFMRDFLYSEISQIEKIPNIPNYPDTAIKAGEGLCQNVLEPIQDALGRLCIRSAFRSCAVNAKGAENKNQFNCSKNESNYAGHIWDVEDANGDIGATACIVVTSFLPYYEKTGDWQALAWWIHDHIPGYSSMFFFPKLSALNITWHQNPEKRIDSYIAPKGCLTKEGMKNQQSSHRKAYDGFLRSITNHPISRRS